MHSLGIVQLDSNKRDHPRNPGGVSESGPVTLGLCQLVRGIGPGLMIAT